MKNIPKADSLAGKVVVITGASSGAGRAIATEFAKHRTKIVVGARRMEALKELTLQCGQLGSEAVAVETDVTEYTAVQNLVKQAIDSFGRIDIWVNNAGVLAAGEFSETPMEVHDQVIRTNLMGYMHGAHAVLPVFKSQQTGILINNISIGGFFPTPYAAGYSASKFGLKGFSDSLKGELHRWPKIHVCDMFPAFLDTPGIKHAANHTGKVLKPAPPVYDPRKLARAAVRLAVNPRRSTSIGAMAYLLKFGVSFAPSLMRLATATLMETYFSAAQQTAKTSGNVFYPMSWGTTIDGTGEGKPGRKTTFAAFAAGALLAGLTLSRYQQRSR
jgi:short-subunit dehydrogenase